MSWAMKAARLAGSPRARDHATVGDADKEGPHRGQCQRDGSKQDPEAAMKPAL
jgi:hypothetical protein